jgi:hypothetical protein
MSNTYLELTSKHEKELNNFPMAFAFSKKQFAEAMATLGLEVADTDKIYSIGNGGFIRKSDSDALEEMFERHAKEMQEAIDNDSTGDGFIFEMFNYELGNHEYCVTWDVGPALDALGLTLDEVNASPKLLHGLQKARKAQG